ncbi:MAG: IS30 family transposase [Rhodanobacter sp.]
MPWSACLAIRREPTISEPPGSRLGPAIAHLLPSLLHHRRQLVHVLREKRKCPGLLRLRRVPNSKADTIMRVIVHTLHPLQARVHTLTWDNGSEFAEHALIDIAVNAKSYFADPYSSWQRGSNENTNGLLWQCLPKRCDLGACTDAEIQAIEDKLNQRPRRRSGFRIPQQVFDASFNRGALRS